MYPCTHTLMDPYTHPHTHTPIQLDMANRSKDDSTSTVVVTDKEIEHLFHSGCQDIYHVLHPTLMLADPCTPAPLHPCTIYPIP